MSDWNTFKTSFAQQCNDAEAAMNEIKHTRGPWHVGERRREFIDIKHSNREAGAISGVLAQAIARTTWESEGEANARLIAAAPTMYEYIESSAMNGCATAKKIMEAINGNA